MCQLMIVDDETSVVDSLALTIPWEEYGIVQVHRAYSAQQALKIAAEQSIDIMITDIQMPEMDGFELIEKIKYFSPRIRNIILSGHDDFHYAQKAIRQQTIEYLLKPVNIKMLINTVKKAIHNIKTELEEAKSYQFLKHSIDVNMQLLKSQLLNDLLNTDLLDLNLLAKRLAVIDVSFKSGELFTMMVIRLDEGFSGYDLQSMSMLEFAVNNIAEEVFGELFELWNCITEQGYLVFLIKSNNPDDLKLIDSYVIELKKYVQTLLKGSLTICLSNLGIFPYDLGSMYQTMIQTIKLDVGKNKSNFITVKDIFQESKRGNTINLHEAPTITSLLEVGDWEGATTRISHILSLNDQKSEPSQDHLFRVLLYLSSSFSTLCKDGDKSIEDQLGEEFHLLMRKRSLITKQRVFDWAEQWIDNIRRKTANHHIDDAQQRIVAAVRSFVHENLSNDMSLQTIAEKVNLHPVYLSKVYKNVTNETIGDYIHQLRMNRADYLLRKTKLKIGDVSKALGFFSQSHFNKVFKKHYGCTPQKYQNRKA